MERERGGIKGVRLTGPVPQVKEGWPHPGEHMLGLPFTQVILPGWGHKDASNCSFASTPVHQSACNKPPVSAVDKHTK